MLYQLSYCRNARREYRAARFRARRGTGDGPRRRHAGVVLGGDALPFTGMRRSAVPALLGLLAVALIVVLAIAMTRTSDDDQRSQSLSAQIEAGKVVPAPGADDKRPLLIGDGEKSLSDFRGQIVVLNFWASWCDPCKQEAPVLDRVHQRLQKDGIGTVLGVTYQDDPVKSRAFMKKYGATYPSLQDPGRVLSQQFGASQMPETFVIDREGRIRAIAYGAVTDKFMDGALERAGAPATR